MQIDVGQVYSSNGKGTFLVTNSILILGFVGQVDL